MKIEVVYYRASYSPLVQAFVNIEVDGWLRFVGLNLLRDGRLWSAQLTTFTGTGTKRIYRDAVQILDPDLRELLTADILDAIQTYIATLPEEERIKPPRPPRSDNVNSGTPEPRKASIQDDHIILNSIRQPEPKINSLNTRIISAGKPVPNGSKHPVAPPTRLQPDKRPLWPRSKQ
jgi:hypothetical protein